MVGDRDGSRQRVFRFRVPLFRGKNISTADRGQNFFRANEKATKCNDVHTSPGHYLLFLDLPALAPVLRGRNVSSSRSGWAVAFEVRIALAAVILDLVMYA